MYVIGERINGMWTDIKKAIVEKDEGPINMIQTTSDGRVWISSQMNGGLRYWDGAAWKVSLDSPLPIRCLLEAKGGQVLAGGVLDGLHVKQ